jgi:DNA gyrase subunit A
MTRRKATPPKSIAVDVIEQNTLETIEHNYFVYGSLTLQDRALSDFRDGMLKVSRRLMWAMHHTSPAGKPVVKSARVVGDLIGKYHPHGDTSGYAALVTLVNSTYPVAEGEGNWGTYEDPPAAARYTNVRMSDKGRDMLMHPDYLSVMQLMPNYDGKDQEPVLLPARLPNVLLNGGIWNKNAWHSVANKAVLTAER